MEDIRTPFLGFLTAQAPTRKSIPSGYTVQLDLSLLDGFIQLVVQQIVTNKLPEEDEMWLIDLVDGLKTEKEVIEAKLLESKEEDPLTGWYLHQRSQSGFELRS